MISRLRAAELCAASFCAAAMVPRSGIARLGTRGLRRYFCARCSWLVMWTRTGCFVCANDALLQWLHWHAGAYDAAHVTCCTECNNGLYTRRLHSMKCASQRAGCVCQMACLAEMRGVRERCLCGHPQPALGLDPGRAHSERVKRRV